MDVKKVNVNKRRPAWRLPLNFWILLKCINQGESRSKEEIVPAQYAVFVKFVDIFKVLNPES